MDDTARNDAARGDTSEVPRFFSLSQRIGRLRYFVYLIGGALGASGSLLMLYVFCLILPPAAARMFFNIGWILLWNILLPMLLVVMIIRRLHDLDAKGWWSLAVLVLYLVSPHLIMLGTLILLAVPGSKGSNRFGPVPRENSSALQATAMILPLLLIVCFLAFKDKTPPMTAANTLPLGMRPLPASNSSNTPPLQTYPQH